MATKVERWVDSRGNLWETEAGANRADLIAHIEEFLQEHGAEGYGEFNSSKAAEALVDEFVLTPRLKQKAPE